jgi:hypothetical protein
MVYKTDTSQAFLYRDMADDKVYIRPLTDDNIDKLYICPLK